MTNTRAPDGANKKLGAWFFSTCWSHWWKELLWSWRSGVIFLHGYRAQSGSVAGKRHSFEMVNIIQVVREAPFNKSPPVFGHCPNSNYPPPPALKRALWGTFFRPDLSDFVKSPFWGYVSATKNPGKPYIPCQQKKIPNLTSIFTA